MAESVLRPHFDIEGYFDVRLVARGHAVLRPVIVVTLSDPELTVPRTSRNSKREPESDGMIDAPVRHVVGFLVRIGDGGR